MAQIYYYDPQTAGINVQSPQSESTPWKLTLLEHIAKRLRLKNDFVVILRTILNEKEFRQDKIFKITRKKQLKVFMI